MLGKDRFQFESPNAIDAGEAPPSAPGRRGRFGGSGVASPRSVASPQDKRIFRGTKIKIGGGDDAMDEDNSLRCSIRSEGSSSLMEFYRSDEESDGEPVHDQLPSPDEARMYAAAVLTESFRRLDSDSEEDAAMAAEALAANEEGRLLSSSAINGWRRPSRRKQHAARKSSMTKDETRRSCVFLSTTVCCSVMLVITAVSFFLVVTMISAKGGNPTAAVSTSNSGSQDENPIDVTQEMVTSPCFLKTIEWLAEHDVSDIKSLTKEGSPQFKAARWISDKDEMNEEIPVLQDIDANYMQFNASAAEQHRAHQLHTKYERFLQRYVLAVYYFSLGGPHWNEELGFLSGNHECAWFQAETANDGAQYAVGVTCNDKLLVQDLFMPGNNLVGTIPTEIQYLRHLELLSVRHNFIKGTIPSELAHLSNSLEYLDLSKNDMSGTLPGQVLGSLRGLKALGLAGNQLQGTVPKDLSSLVNLLTLDLGHNENLQGQVKTVLGQMTNLRYLYLEYNQFEDTVDDSFLRDLPHLQEVSINDNKLKSVGELPFHLISHQNLTLLDLSNNFLVGSLPNTFVSTSNVNSKMKVLNLAHNQLTGTIPLAIQMLSDLEYMDLSNNAFQGAIPVSMGNMKELSHIYLGDNNFEPGIIPPVFFTDMHLKVLSLPNTQLTGRIPQYFSMLTALSHLDLRNNRLTGSIPPEVWSLPSLSTLLLKSNMLQSKLPEIFPETQLEIVALDDNGGITGNASGICTSSNVLTTFTYSCDKVSCTGPCCHSECCAATASDECASVLLDSNLQTMEEEEIRALQANRTVYSFSPRIIRENHA